MGEGSLRSRRMRVGRSAAPAYAAMGLVVLLASASSAGAYFARNVYVANNSFTSAAVFAGRTVRRPGVEAGRRFRRSRHKQADRRVRYGLPVVHGLGIGLPIPSPQGRRGQ